VVSFSFKYN